MTTLKHDTSHHLRLEQNDSLTDPLKKIELFKAIASPAYIVALLEDFNEIREGLLTSTLLRQFNW